MRIATPSTDTDGEETAAKALTPDELGKLVAATPDRWRLLIEFLAETGLRVSEGLALEWRDLDLGTKRVRIERRLYRGRIAPPKSKYGRRVVPVTSAMAQRLWSARKASNAVADDDPVFASRTGGRLDAGNVFNRVVKPAARAAGVPWAGFHTLRHTCATELFRRGMNAKQAQVWLGHHSPAFTLSVYTHLLSEDLPDSPFEVGNTGATRPTETGREGEGSSIPESTDLQAVSA